MKIKSKKVIKASNCPTRWPILYPIVWFLLLDRLKAPAWLFVALGCLYFIIFTVLFVNKLTTNEQEVDIFDNDSSQ